MYNEGCRVSADELNHDIAETKAIDQMQAAQEGLAEIINIKRANIIEGDGQAVMNEVLDEITLMQMRHLFNAWRDGDPALVGNIFCSMIEQQVNVFALDQAEAEIPRIVEAVVKV